MSESQRYLSLCVQNVLRDILNIVGLGYLFFEGIFLWCVQHTYLKII